MDFEIIIKYLKNILLYKEDAPLLFTQFYFWAFFAIVFAFFTLFHNRRLLRNTFLFFASLFFYYKTSGLFLLILIFSTVIDFFIGKKIYSSQKKATKKFYLFLSVFANLFVLAYFKYAYFFTETFNNIFNTDFHVLNYFVKWTNTLTGSGFDFDVIMLPVGVSFFTFQTISYTIDIYRNKLKPVRNIFDFGFYVSFFPQLVAGPIVLASEFVPQLYNKFRLSRMQFGIAIFWILNKFRLSRMQFGIAIFWILNGLTKKMILGDYLAVNFVDRIFANPLLYSGFENLMALIGYSVQVYADFSGYTDIAIGVAMLMGFHLPINFNSPYKASNLVDFWRRWHISLSRWLKDYLYIPLGGNKKGTFATFLLLAIIISVVLLLSNIEASLLILIIYELIIIFAILLIIPKFRKIFITNINIMVTMLIGGLWHGASWNFMIWGGLNGVGIVFYKYWKRKNRLFQFVFSFFILSSSYLLNYFLPNPLTNIVLICVIIVFAAIFIQSIFSLLKIGSYFKFVNHAWSVFITFMFVSFTRLFFRSGSNLEPAETNKIANETAQNMINQIGGKWNFELIPQMIYSYRYVFAMIIFGLIIHWLPTKTKQWYRINFARMPRFILLLSVIITVFIIYQFSIE